MTAQTVSRGDADVARTAALIGDPTRARVLAALGDGRALAASTLAAEAGVAASTISEHLARLLDAALVSVEQQGRARYYRLASADVADALEALARISPPQPIRSLRQGTEAHALRYARTCYHHLAGRVGVALMRALLDEKVLTGGDGVIHRERAHRDRLSGPGRDVSYRLTSTGRKSTRRIRRRSGRGRAEPTGDPLLPRLVGATASPGRPARRRPHRPAVRPRLAAASTARPSRHTHRRR